MVIEGGIIMAGESYIHGSQCRKKSLLIAVLGASSSFASACYVSAWLSSTWAGIGIGSGGFGITAAIYFQMNQKQKKDAFKECTPV